MVKEKTMQNEVSNPASCQTAIKRGLGLIKVCPNPKCEAVYHNCPKKHTKCNDCGARIMQVNEHTFWKKFSNNWFQYDFLTGEYYRPQKQENQLVLNLA